MDDSYSSTGSDSGKDDTTTEGDDGGKTDDTGSQTSGSVSVPKSRPEAGTSGVPNKSAKIKRGPGRPPGSGTKNNGKALKKGLMGKLKIKLGSQLPLKRPRGRPPKNKTMQQLYLIKGAAGKKIRPGPNMPKRRGPGRPKGSKTKKTSIPGEKGEKPAVTAPKKRKVSVNGDTEGMNGGTTTEGAEEKEGELRAFWRPPSDSKPLLDTVFITDVTSNMLTITVRESTTDKGFFKAREPLPEEPVSS